MGPQTPNCTACFKHLYHVHKNTNFQVAFVNVLRNNHFAKLIFWNRGRQGYEMRPSGLKNTLLLKVENFAYFGHFGPHNYFLNFSQSQFIWSHDSKSEIAYH
jgi:hypothetical protein